MPCRRASSRRARARSPPIADVGPGGRVDACGYVGLAPPPQFDPLLAKLICQSGSRARSTRRSIGPRALDEFHIAGVPTNVDRLRADPWRVQSSVRRSAPGPALRSDRRRRKAGALQFLDQQVAALGRGPRRHRRRRPAVPPGDEAIESPHAGSVVDIKVREGGPVKAGDLLFVVSAMKMETSVAAPCAGTVETLTRWPSATRSKQGGQILAVLKPAAGAAGPRRL